MPLYEYQCRACSHCFEALVRGSEQPTCPSCHSDDLERLLSMFAVSSDGVRQSNLKAARQRHAKVKQEKEIAYQEQVRDHHH
jgi:putative FmdB family regulatory protein